jgi:hypothetical protein
MADANDICVQCGESRGAIRREGLICARVDYFGEVDYEFDHHRFRHVVTVRRDSMRGDLWLIICVCGFGQWDETRFPTRNAAMRAAAMHRHEANPKSSDSGSAS